MVVHDPNGGRYVRLLRHTKLPPVGPDSETVSVPPALVGFARTDWEGAHMAMELSEIADRVAIQDLMYRYAMAVDGRDWTLYRTVFSADAVIDYVDSGGIRADL